MRDAEVWVNGIKVGGWHYGYTSFALDITTYIKPHTQNTIAVRVENKDFSSRWYPGAGIYRDVWLTITNPVHIAHWGTFVTTPSVSDDKAKVNVATTVQNQSAYSQLMTLETCIFNAENKMVARFSSSDTIISQDQLEIMHELTIQTPRRWDINDPYLYRAISKIRQDGKLIDDYQTSFGIRTFKFDADEGFSLNGRTLKLNGVNMHHDLGPLGAAVNYRATERQLEIMKSMGVNAIRTAHNPPSPEQMDLCDKMGILVMDESFDEWRKPKNMYTNSYSYAFDEWAELDMRALVLRDRNHPSVVLWSTGNEVPELGTGKVSIDGEWAIHYDQKGQLVTFHEGDETYFGRYDGETLNLDVNERTARKLAQRDDAPSLSGTTWDIKRVNEIYHYDFWDDDGGKLSAQRLTDICHELDPTRPVGSGIHLSIRLDQELMDKFDVGGFNYWHESIKELHEIYPDKPLLVTEASATLSTRGEYHFPVERIYRRYIHESMQISSYDLINTGFGALPDLEFKLQNDNPWLAGQFVWSGFDYHGEPDPYEDMWPAHSSYFGIVDMCGFPKDRYYLYQSEWTAEPMIHLLPHWNWAGREGETTPIFCYTNCASAELFVNGVSQGKRVKAKDVYRLRWDDVGYQPGSIKVIGFDEEGHVIQEKEVFTAGEPYRIELSADRHIITADGEDLAFVTVRILDEAGNICPRADNLVEFQVNGVAELFAVGNGNPISIESYQASHRKAFNGLCLAIVRSDGHNGEISFEASSEGIEGHQLSLSAE